METDIPSPRRSAYYFSGCAAAPSCFPVYPNPSRFHLLGHEATHKSRSWPKLLLIKRLLKEGRKSIGCPKPLSFGYDAVSYAKNFDDGSCNERSGQRFVDAGGWRTRAS